MSDNNQPAQNAGSLDDNFSRHIQFPANIGVLDKPSGKAVGIGQCGDALEVTLRVQDERITDIRYIPHGCLFTVACASAMSELAKHKTIDQALELSPVDVEAVLGGLPEDHVHCARLAINTLGEAIADCYRGVDVPVAAADEPPKKERTSDAHL